MAKKFNQAKFASWKFLTKGYKEDLDDIINNALFPSNASEMVIVKNIELYSMCEHHLLPFYGHLAPQSRRDNHSR